jgi:putative DNA primase/helicase
MQHGVLVDDARVIPAGADMPFPDDGIDWLALPLTNPKGDVVSLAYLHPEQNQKPRYFDGYAKGAYVPIKPQRGQVVHVVSNPQDGRMLWLAGVAAVVCFTPDDWSVPDLPNPFGDSEPYQPKGGNMAHVARAWVKAGHAVAVPVTHDRVSYYSELLSDTGAVILPIPEPLTWLEVHELGELPQQLADLIKTALQTTADTWPEPEPLTDPDQQAPYPLHALPPDLQALVKEIQQYYQAPVPMIATCALSILSSAGQALADVDIDGTLKKPLSLFTLIVAESGERKSEIDKVLSKPLHEWERQQLEDKSEEIKVARAEHKAWEAAKRGIEKRIETLASKDQDFSQAKEKLAELEANPPQAVLIPDLIMQDQTPEGMAKALKRYPSICLLSSEAAVVLGGHGMGKDSASRNQGMMNDLWSGQPIKITRAMAESFSLHGRRLSAGLAVQQSVLSAFAKDGAARGIGFFARFLITQPDSTKGTRFYKAPSEWRHLSAWRDRIHALLNTPLQIDPDNALQPELLQLHPDAKQLWIEGYNAIERELGQFGEFADVGDVASKSADNAARIAGLLHLYQHGLVGRVTADEMRCGLALALWHLNESKRYFTKAKTDEKTLLAARLEQWLIVQCREQQATGIPLRQAYQNVIPKAARGKKAFLQCITPLIDSHRAKIETQHGSEYVLINPILLEPQTGATRATGATTCANP